MEELMNERWYFILKKGIVWMIVLAMTVFLVSCGATGQDRSQFEAHNWNEFQYEMDEHFRECMDEGCGAVDREKHLTHQKICEEIQICDVCHYEYGDVLAHVYDENGICTQCMGKQHGEGLEYFHAVDYYVVAGVGKCRYPDIEISSVYKWLPVTEIAEHAFARASHVESIVVPDSVKKIGWGAFSGCDGLRSIMLPPEITSIEGNLFHNCKALDTLVIPDRVTHIGDHAFYHCESLTSIRLPASLAKIDGTPFAGCSSLETIVFGGTKEEFEAIEKAAASIPQGLAVTCSDGNWQAS